MSVTPAEPGPPFGPRPAGGIPASYDAVADEYAARLGDELADKPLDRALLAALLDLAGPGPVADLGCGPGHITRYLAARHADVHGIDLSPRMIALARAAAPGATCTVGSMLDLPTPAASLAGAVAFYSIVHMSDAERAVACREFARTLRPGGWLLLSFHIDAPDFPSGTDNRLTTLFDAPVDLTFRFLAPGDVVADLEAAGFTVAATTIRQAVPDAEYPSRRCYLLAQAKIDLVPVPARAQ